jgi:hypothetical protein
LSTNATIEDAVRASLILDPRIPEPGEVALSADDGTVTLRGTVGSFTQRRAAVSNTKQTDGVYDVDDQLQVRLLNEARREDADIRGAALQILLWDTEVPADLIDVKVDGGWVTLAGNVGYEFESDAAYDDVAALLGVVGVTSEITVNAL